MAEVAHVAGVAGRRGAAAGRRRRLGPAAAPAVPALTYDELLARNRLLEKQNRRLKKQNEALRLKAKPIYNARRATGRWKDRCVASRQNAKRKQSEIDGKLFTKPLKRHKRKKRVRWCLSVRGGYRLAIKRNLGHCNTATLMKIVETNVSKWALNNWERLLAANIVVQSRQWYEDQYVMLEEQRAVALSLGTAASLTTSSFDITMPHKKLFSYEIHSIRGDATNTAYTGCKGHVCEVVSKFCQLAFPEAHEVEEGPDAGGAGFDGGGDAVIDNCCFAQTESHRIYTDLAKVPKKCGGLESRAIFLNQVGSTGAHTWVANSGFSETNVITGVNSLGILWLCFHICIYLFTTDNGGDQIANDVLFELDVAALALTCYAREWCRRHQLHLMKKRQFQRQPWYWSYLATFANVARSTHTPMLMLESYRRLFGDLRARVMKRLMPRPLSVRWGAATAAEKWYINAGFEEVGDVMVDVFGLPEELEPPEGVVGAAVADPAPKAKGKATIKYSYMFLFVCYDFVLKFVDVILFHFWFRLSYFSFLAHLAFAGPLPPWRPRGCPRRPIGPSAAPRFPRRV